MIINRNSKVNKSFTLTAVDDTDQPFPITGDPVDVAITELGIQPTESDWKACDWSETNSDRVVIPFNLPGGFPIADWEPGTYWWKVRPHDLPEVPVLDGPDFIEIV